MSRRLLSLASLAVIVSAVLATGKVVVTDLVEYNPAFDIDDRGAKTAARLAWLVAKEWPVMAAPATEG